MTCTDEAVKRHIRLGEDSLREFKQVEFSGRKLTSPKRHDLADEIASLANAKGGVLLCGITDQGDVQGLTRDQVVALDSVLAEVSSDSIKPAVRLNIYHVEVDGSLVLVVEVPEGESQYDSPGGSYVRVGATRRKMTSEERLRLAQRRGQARFPSFDEQALPNTGFATLEKSLWRPFLTAEGAMKPEAALRQLALLADDDSGTPRATVAGILLCTQRPDQWLPGARIMATRYRGSDRASGQIDAQEITGPLNRQVAEALAFSVRNMTVGAHKNPARQNLPQYSRKALFEAVVNAVAHRDYSMHGSAIRLSIFAQRLEIQSPGALPNNLSLESMEVRQATRNEALASILGRMSVQGIQGSRHRRYFMERRGDGVSIIRRKTAEVSGQFPAYDLIDDSELRLTIPAAVPDNSPARVVITVRRAGQPLPNADFLVLFPNKTWKRAVSDGHGEAEVDLYTTQLPITVFVAAAGVAAHVERDWKPSRCALAVELQPLPNGGSVIFAVSTGHVPGIKGRLNPILDSHDRCYLYASNIAINRGLQQPVHFLPGEALRLTDSKGREVMIRVAAILGRSALVEYWPCQG